MVSPQHEDYWGNVNPFGIRSCYDEGKRGGETLFHDYNKAYGIDTRVARIFNTYGPNMSLNDGRVVSNLLVQALNNFDVTVYGDGTQIRSLCYVSDLVDGLIKLLFAEPTHQPINLGNPDPIKISDLALEIIELTSSKSSLVFKELPLDDPQSRIPDISKAKRILDWEPIIKRQVGLKLTMEYFIEKMDI